MFDRFTRSARSVIMTARDMAHSAGRQSIEPVDIMLAMIRLYPQLFEGLSSHDIDLQLIQRELVELAESSSVSQMPRRMRLTDRAKRVMRTAMQEARSCWELWEAPRRKRDEMSLEDHRYWEARLHQPLKIAQLPKWFVRWRLRRNWEVDERHLLLGLLEETEEPGVALLLKRGVTPEAARQRLCAKKE